MKPLVLSTTVHIPAPPEAVWSVLVDVGTWEAWCPPVRRVTHGGSGELQVGQRLAYVLGMGPGVPVSFDVVLQAVDRPRELRWWSTKWWGVSATRAFLLTPEEGGTRVEDRKTFESRIWPVATLYPTSIVGAMSDGWLQGLHDEVRRRDSDLISDA